MTVAEGDVLDGTGLTLAATEGTAFSGAVATFSNTGYASNPASDFNATIDWGDGTTDTGTVSGDGGQYTVSGTHTYDEREHVLAGRYPDGQRWHGQRDGLQCDDRCRRGRCPWMAPA